MKSLLPILYRNIEEKWELSTAHSLPGRDQGIGRVREGTMISGHSWAEIRNLG